MFVLQTKKIATLTYQQPITRTKHSRSMCVGTYSMVKSRPRRPRTGGNDDDDDHQQQRIKNKKQQEEHFREMCRVVISSNRSIYYSPSMNAANFVNLLVQKWGHPCKVTFFKSQGYLHLRVYPDDLVKLPHNMPMYDDICYRLNSMNSGLLATECIQAADPDAWEHSPPSAFNIMGMFGRPTRTKDILLYIPIEGPRTVEFILGDSDTGLIDP